jgi:hypothetical protein
VVLLRTLEFRRRVLRVAAERVADRGTRNVRASDARAFLAAGNGERYRLDQSAGWDGSKLF